MGRFMVSGSDGPRHYILLSPALLYARHWLRDLQRWIGYWQGLESPITWNFITPDKPLPAFSQAVLPCFAVKVQGFTPDKNNLSNDKTTSIYDKKGSPDPTNAAGRFRFSFATAVLLENNGFSVVKKWIECKQIKKDE